MIRTADDAASFRPIWLQLFQWIGAPAAFVIWAYTAVQILTSDAYRHRAGDRFGIAEFCVVVGALFALSFIGLGRCRMLVTGTDLLVVNPIRRYAIPRADVLRIGVTPRRSWAVIQTRSGKRVPVFALSMGLRWTFRRLMNEVNAALGFDST